MNLATLRCPKCNRMSLESETLEGYAVAHCVVCGFDEIPEFMHDETLEDEWDDCD